MNVKTNSTSTISWDIDLCSSEAIIENNKLASIKIESKVAKDNILVSTDEQFIRDTYKALGELITHLDNVRGFNKKNEPIYMDSDNKFHSMLDVMTENNQESVLQLFSGN